MAWLWVLLLLRLEPTIMEGDEEDQVGFNLCARYFEVEKPHFATYSSPWNEYLKARGRKPVVPVHPNRGR